MLAALSPLIAVLPDSIGVIGGFVGIFSGVAVFARRRVRLLIRVTQNNDAHNCRHTITISNRSDLAVSYRDVAIAWFITTPLGRRRITWAYCPEDETKMHSLAPHAADEIRISDEFWSLAKPRERQKNAFMRATLFLSSKGGNIWLPVGETTWADDTWRDRLIDRLYKVNAPSRSPFQE